ncbi:GntR family transcriptional regulator [Pigmentiphaga daeguensis]|uniref:GntR family transcriptional regulator n=1 Tax=Pigmentiphaga daeguensis TaxID=414049 RepID=A0ABN1CXI3_9BURK
MLEPDDALPAGRIVPATLASQTYERLRRDIVDAHYAPGQKLGTRQLSERYDVGLAPLREALTRLSREGLVVQHDRRGFAVPNFGGAHLEELSRTRSWLNDIALRASIDYADQTWVQGLVQAYHRLARLDRYLKGKDGPHENPEWEAAHRDFHTALIAGCRSRWMIDYCNQMFEASTYYRRYSRITAEYRKGRENEHEKLFQAAVSLQADEAARLMRKHVMETAQRVQERLLAESARPGLRS